MDRFNNFAWASISFEQLHDNLLFVALRRGKGIVEGDGEGDEEEEEEVRGTKKAQWSGWGYKGFSYAFQVWAYEKISKLEKAPTFLQDGRSDSYTENFAVKDNKETADPRVVTVVYNQEPRAIKEIVLTEAARKKTYWASGDDADVVIGENLTLDINDVCELKMQLKELKVSFERLAHEKEISDKNLVKKVEELLKVVGELRRVVMEKPVEHNTNEEDEGKKDMGEKVEEDGEDEEEGEEEKKKSKDD